MAEAAPRDPLTAAQVRFVAPRHAGGHGLHATHNEDCCNTLASNPMRHSLGFLEWSTPTPLGMVSVERFQLQGVLLATMGFGTEPADRLAFQQSNLLEQELNATFISTAALAIGQTPIFDSVYSSTCSLLGVIIR